MTDGQAEKSESKYILRKEWDHNMIISQIEINNNVKMISIRNRTEWSTIQGVIG